MTPRLPSWSLHTPQTAAPTIPQGEPVSRDVGAAPIELTLWLTGIDPGPEAVTVTGPVAALLVDALSWIHEQTMAPIEPEPEPQIPEAVRAELESWARRLAGLADEMREAADR